MRKINRKSKEIRDFILKNVTSHPKDIGHLAARQFGISRQALSKHLNALVTEGYLSVSGETRARGFRLRNTLEKNFQFPVTMELEEDAIWRESVRPLLTDLPENVLDICHYGFTEMFNNVIDHSGSTTVEIHITRTAVDVEIVVHDHGIGIFNKIQKDFSLHDPRHSLLELAKGKLTSDKSKHTGEGIFFTSRMFDVFHIWSGTLFFSRTNRKDDWLIETENKNEMKGTMIDMKINSSSDRTIKEVFDQFSAEHHDYGFTRTHVPLELLRYEGEKLLSRSQAKRLLARVEQFREVTLDFRGITTIGQAFADEIFRVFAREHPDIIILPINTTPEIEQIIHRAISVNGDT